MKCFFSYAKNDKYISFNFFEKSQFCLMQWEDFRQQNAGYYSIF